MGLDVAGYISLEKLIEKRKDDYYAALEKSSDKWPERENDYIPFVEYILRVIVRAYHELDDHFVEVSQEEGHQAGKNRGDSDEHLRSDVQI